jgi:DNA repair exonuclease SbcCD ATPase subunit
MLGEIMTGELLKGFRKTVDSKTAIRNNTCSRLEKASVELKQLHKLQKQHEEVLFILQTVAKQTQEQLEYKISELVSLALESVFDNPYKMRLVYETKRNKTEASILFERGGEQFFPIQASGGGAVDIAAFALRVALWSLADKKTDNVLVLDEPFRFLSRDKLERAGLMMKEISEKLGLQIVMVSHLDELIAGADKVFKVSQSKGVSKVGVN